jgi:hypothetical protein
MPTDTIIVVAGIVIAFAAFVIAVAWADYQTRIS